MKKLAIIGGGIAGITAAYSFQDRYQITLFESQNYIGGNNRSIDIGGGIRVPLVVILFPRKQIFTQTIHFAKKFGLNVQNKIIGHSFLKEGKVEYKALSNPLTSLLDIKDFLYWIGFFKKYRFSKGKIVQDLISENKLSKKFVESLLIPLACLYLSMSYEDVFNMPLNVLADWYYKYLLVRPWAPLQFSFIKAGNHQLVEEFLKRTNLDINLNSKINSVHRDKNFITINSENTSQKFDKVIFACPPHETLRLLANPTEIESSLLNTIKSTQVTCILHTDATKCYNGNITMDVVCDSQNKKSLITTFSEDCFDYNLEKKHFVTIEHPGSNTIEPNFIIYKQNFETPKTTSETLSIIDKLPQLNHNSLNTMYCGSYFGKYFYHEDAIQSALNIDKLDRERSA